MALLLSRSVARPPGHRAKKNYVPGKTRGMVYTIGPERKIYTIEASYPEKEKGGFLQWWCIFLSPVSRLVEVSVCVGECASLCVSLCAAGKQ